MEVRNEASGPYNIVFKTSPPPTPEKKKCFGPQFKEVILTVIFHKNVRTMHRYAYKLEPM